MPGPTADVSKSPLPSALTIKDEPEATDSLHGSCFLSLLDEAMLIDAKLRVQYESLMQDMSSLRAENEYLRGQLRSQGDVGQARAPSKELFRQATLDTVNSWTSSLPRPTKQELRDYERSACTSLHFSRQVTAPTGVDRRLGDATGSSHVLRPAFATSVSPIAMGGRLVPFRRPDDRNGYAAQALGREVWKKPGEEDNSSQRTKRLLNLYDEASKVADAAVEGRLAQQGCARVQLTGLRAADRQRPPTPESPSEDESDASVNSSTARPISPSGAASKPPRGGPTAAQTRSNNNSLTVTPKPSADSLPMLPGVRKPTSLRMSDNSGSSAGNLLTSKEGNLAALVQLSPTSGVPIVGERAMVMCDFGDCSEPLRRKDRRICTVDSVATMGNTPQERSVVLQRLRLRLGVVGHKNTVTGPLLHNAVSAVGLTKYSVSRLTEMIVCLNQGGESKGLRWLQSLGRKSTRWAFKLRELLAVSQGTFANTGIASAVLPGAEVTYDPGDPTQINFQRFARILLDPSAQVNMDSDVVEMLTTIAEVLLASDANRVIAELTNTRIDDLASPPPSMDLLMALEPFVGFMILLNGALIGIQSDESIALWQGWTWLEVCFCLFFGTEFALRVSVAGFKGHFCGDDASWNIFDFTILVFAVFDLFASFAGSGTLLRLVRLTRLSRVFRMFRLNMLKELTLMLKGLLGGFKTLGWAMVLLLSSIYVIALCFHMVVSDDPALPVVIDDAAEYFSTVPRCMFTAFRCLTGDCTDSQGRSLASILAREYGVQFAVPYIVCVMLITFGIFNLIIAIYIEATMSAAKVIDEGDRERRKRESIRVAHLTKSLLKKFCLAVKIANKHIGEDITEVFAKTCSVRHDQLNLQDMCMDEEDDGQPDDFESIIITKDIFLLVVQDRGVQAMMDDLDIPPERAHLFDVLDADGSGGLAVTELVQGLLKVRGEARRSDMVACLLGIRAVQDMLREVADRYKAVAIPTASGGAASWATSQAC